MKKMRKKTSVSKHKDIFCPILGLTELLVMGYF